MKCFMLSLVMIVVGNGVYSQISETTYFPPASTSFTCHGRPPGYYADIETNCKTYHVCDGHTHFTYICPSRTLFQQRTRICDHSYLVHCEDSINFYEDFTDFEDSKETFFSSDRGYNQTEETTAENPTTTENPTTIQPRFDESIPEFLKIQIKDFRSLFFIPEVENNSVVGKPEKEFWLALEKPEVVKFKKEKKTPKGLCPSHCDPKFFLPGSCHPCIFIK